MAQTDGEPLPTPAQASGDPGSALERLRAAVAAQGVTLEYVEHLGGALGTSSGGRVQVIAGLAPAVEFLVVAHEHAHEIMHHGEDRPDSRETRELEAEAVAFVVAQAIGIDASETTRDYIHLYHGDSAALGQSLDRIQKTAAAIIRALDGDA